MPGGLQGRLQREQLKSMKLDNARRAMDMNSIDPLIQQAAGLQQVARQGQEMDMRANMAPQLWDKQQSEMQNDQLVQQAQGIEMAQQGGYDVKALLEQYLQQFGMNQQLQPVPQQTFGAPTVSPEELAAQEEFRKAIMGLAGQKQPIR